MKTFKITYTDTITAETEEEAYDIFSAYLSECVKFEDLTAYGFEEIDTIKN